MPRGKPRLPAVVDDNDLRPLPSRPRVRESATVWNEAVAIVQPRKVMTTGQTMMKVRQLIAARTGEAWHAVARLRPLSEEDDARFAVYARCASGSQWVGEYDADLSDEDCIALVEDVVAMRNADEPVAAPKLETDENGDVIARPELIGQRREITLANGNVVPVTIRRADVGESDTQMAQRLRAELASASKVILMAERDEFVGWNGQNYWIHPGANEVPKAVADLYLQSLEGQRQARARMSVVLNETQAMAWVDNARRGA